MITTIIFAIKISKNNCNLNDYNQSILSEHRALNGGGYTSQEYQNSK